MPKTVEEYLAEHPAHIQEIAQKARGLVSSVLPHKVEKVLEGYNMIGYTNGEKKKMAGIVCYIAAYKAHVNLGFIWGTSLPDPHGLLQGTGKSLRHVKLRKPEDVDSPALRGLLEAAGALDRKPEEAVL